MLAHEQIRDRELVLLAFVAHERERPRLAPDVEAPRLARLDAKADRLVEPVRRLEVANADPEVVEPA